MKEFQKTRPGVFSNKFVDALVHVSTLGTLHRDIKLTNIFIDISRLIHLILSSPLLPKCKGRLERLVKV